MEFKESLEDVAGKQGAEKALSLLSRRVSEEESRILDQMKQIDALLEGGTDAAHLPEGTRSALWQALEYRKYLKSIERDLKAQTGPTASPKH
jgi:molecular chaperone HscB